MTAKFVKSSLIQIHPSPRNDHLRGEEGRYTSVVYTEERKTEKALATAMDHRGFDCPRLSVSGHVFYRLLFCAPDK